MQQMIRLVMLLTRVRAGLPFCLLAPWPATLHSPRVPLTTPERLFIEQRRARKTFGLYILPVMLLVLVAVWGALFVWWPSVVNPKTMLGDIKTMDPGTLNFYAITASVLTNVILALLGAIVVLRIVWSSSERRYLRLIEKLEQELITHVPAGIAAPLTASEVRQ